MLELVPKSWLSWDFDVLENGETVAQVDMSSWRERGEITVLGKPHKVYRDGMTGPFLLEADGAVVARAIKDSAFTSSFTIEHAGRDYVLGKTSWLGGTFALMEGERERGRMNSVAFFSHRGQANFPETLPLAVRVFLTWLVMIMWKRDTESAGASSASAASAG